MSLDEDFTEDESFRKLCKAALIIFAAVLAEVITLVIIIG